MPVPHLSTRISLRWPPEPAFENTDTLVLSLGNWYVDLRVDRESGSIDWAIAGERLQVPGSVEVLFTHELDSRNSFGVADCGSFSALPNGDELEIGSMPRTDLPGAPVRAYEEVWRELSFPSLPSPFEAGESRGLVGSWILEGGGVEDLRLEEGEETEVVRTFAGAVLGRMYLVLRQRQVVVRPFGEGKGEGKVVVRSGGEVSARREEYVAGVGFEVRYLLGSMAEELPAWEEMQLLRLQRLPGEKFVIKGEEYVVRAFQDEDGA